MKNNREHAPATIQAESGIPAVSYLLAVILLLGGAFYYFWNPSEAEHESLSREATGLYHHLTDAFLSGHLSVTPDPDPALVQLRDPYDPTSNAPFRRSDLSYFHGHYFLYHSAVPVLLLFLPVKVLTGSYLAESTAVAVFCFLTALSGLGCLLVARSSFYSRAPQLLLFWTGAVIVFGSGQFAVLRDSSANHVAISCAASLQMASFFTSLMSFRKRSRTASWLALTGALEALAVNSRPNYIYGLLGVSIILSFHLRSHFGGPRDRTRHVQFASALLMPIVVIGALSIWYNTARFDRPFELGARFMLGPWDQTHLSVVSLNGSGVNAWNYFMAPGALHRYFPFLTAPTWTSIGVLPAMPFVALASLPFFLPGKKGLYFAAFVLFVFAANALSLVFLPSGNPQLVLTSSNSRYILDFVPALCLLACMGALAAGDAFARRDETRIWATACIVFLASLTIVSNLSLDMQRLPNGSYRRFAEILNVPTSFYERLSGQRFGPVSFDAEFPMGLVGQTDPLVLTGTRGASDLVYVTYYSPGSVAFGLASDGIAGPTGIPVSIDYTRPHHIEIWMPSLYPPIGHPALRHMSDDAVTIAKRRLRIALDAVTVLDEEVSGHDTTPDRVKFGSNVGTGLQGSGAFRGHIEHVARMPFIDGRDRVPAPVFGAVQLVVRFPLHNVGASEPLVVTGSPSAGDFIYVTYLSADTVQVGFDHWGHALTTSPPLKLDFAVPHVFAISMASLFHDGAGKRGVSVTLDGKRVLYSTQDTYDSSPYEVSIARNPIGGSLCKYSFTGLILASSRPLNQFSR